MEKSDQEARRPQNNDDEPGAKPTPGAASDDRGKTMDDYGKRMKDKLARRQQIEQVQQ